MKFIRLRKDTLGAFILQKPTADLSEASVGLNRPGGCYSVVP